MANQLDRENWMSHLDGTVRILDSYIPASHDSSCYPTADVVQMMKNEFVGAVTQLSSYTAQLSAGVRYFDMRVAWNNNDLYMHHSDYYYERFVDVLAQINGFAKDHPKEVIFMDIDFDANDTNLAAHIMEALETNMDTSIFATNLLNPDGSFNTGLTWNDLAGIQFVIIWTTNDNAGRKWANYKANARWNHYDDYNLKSVDQIIENLTHYVNIWTKDKLNVSQVINTPLVSFVTPPSELDGDAQEAFNDWIMGYSKGSNLNIIKRDFVNAGYNRAAIDHIINLNSFSSEPSFIPSFNVVHQMDTVCFCTEGGKYISLGQDNLLTLIDTLDDTCYFMVRDYDYGARGELPYSGNLNADGIADQGNFRFARVTYATPVNNTVISVNTDKNNVLYSGIDWGPSGNNETFMCYDPDDINNNGKMYYESRVIIRSMLGMSENAFQKIGGAIKERLMGIIPVVGPALEKAWQESGGRHLFLMVTYDKSGKENINALSPGTGYATTFIIRLINSDISGSGN